MGRLASVKPTGCPGVTPKLALRVLTHRQHTHYPANDGITALTHHVATCKRWEDGNRLSPEKEERSQEKQLSVRKKEIKKGSKEENKRNKERKQARKKDRRAGRKKERKKEKVEINSQEWRFR